MRKIETIWHHLLVSALIENKYKHTQKELAQFFGYSLSTINHALKAPAQIGAIRKESKFFVLADFQKLLYFWASLRNLERDLIFSTFVEGAINQIEGMVPPQAIFATYSAARRFLAEPPSDYDKVYFYLESDQLAEVKRRFPPTAKRKSPNLFVLKKVKTLETYGPVTTLPQTFVDIWNLKDWYAKEFTQSIEQKMYGILS